MAKRYLNRESIEDLLSVPVPSDYEYDTDTDSEEEVLNLLNMLSCLGMMQKMTSVSLKWMRLADSAPK